jgi:hypothetical protein
MLTKKEQKKLRRGKRILKRLGVNVGGVGVGVGGKGDDVRRMMSIMLRELTQTGLEMQRDKQDRILLGIDAPPPPKVKVSF